MSNNITNISILSSAFLLALKSIHDTGVRHRDIRPANLLVNEDTGEVAIIDFDRSEMDKSKSTTRQEKAKLESILDGKAHRKGLSGPSLEV